MDGYRLDPDLFELTHFGERVPLEPQAFDVLVFLVLHRDRVVSKEELMDSIWGGRFVTEAAVTSRIKQVRRALGDDGERQRSIRTVHGRGYRFVADVEDASSAVPEKQHPAGPAPDAPPPTPSGPDGQRPSPGDHNLVASLNHLIGRGSELAELAAGVEAHRLVTIVGPGGIGKSRLALEAARRRRDADGPWFVELAGLSDGSLLAETVATALRIPSAVDAAALAEVLRERSLLLILDNCEQITGDVADFVAELLTRCFDVRVLATSRQRLGGPAEWVLELAPLASNAAEQLFLERAAAVVPGWSPDAGERKLLQRLCDRLDRLPLALELAAAQCRALSVAQLGEQLSDRFGLLSGGRGRDRRHASMAAAVAWSYDSLSPEECELFEALCLLEGSFDLDGVRAVAGDRAALPVLLSLVDKSLVAVLYGSPRRYRVLETLREYAGQRRTPERTRQVQRQIVSWVAALAERAETELFGPRSREWMERLELDKETIRAALAWSADDPATRLGIAVGMMWFWYRRGHIVEGLRALGPLSANPETPEIGDALLPSQVRLRGAVGVVLLCYLAGDYRRIPAELEHARSLVAGTDDEAARSYAMAAIAYFEAGSGATDQALAHASTALEIGRRLGSDQFISFSLLTMAMAELRAGHAVEAERSAAEGLRHADACGFAWGAVASGWIMCKARITSGDLSAPTVAGLARVVADSALNRDITSWLVGLVSEAYVLLRVGFERQAAELVGIAARQGQRIGFAPEAMDPVETRQYLDQTMQAIRGAELMGCYEQGFGLDTQAAFERAAELISTVQAELISTR
jgi:predicted ATPase/DNA-binding winged helix-turn-helix (wHTH) protein